MKYRRRTSLNEVAAHQADNATIRIPPSKKIKLLFMAQMQRVIFTDDAYGFQKNPSFLKKFDNRG